MHITKQYKNSPGAAVKPTIPRRSITMRLPTDVVAFLHQMALVTHRPMTQVVVDLVLAEVARTNAPITTPLLADEPAPRLPATASEPSR